jgi:fused signal recognition particle receptor
MWSAIKARLTGRTEERTAAASPSTSNSAPSKGPDGVAFTDSWLGKGLKESTVDEVMDEMEIVLLQSDVAVPVVERIRADLKRDLAGRKLRWGADTEAAIRASLSRSVRSILDRPRPDLIALIKAHRPEPYVILFVGVNGTGKTTTIAKLAGWMRNLDLGIVIAAGDTFRAGAIEQLLVHGERLGIKVVRQQEGSDPAAVAFDAIQHAKARHLDVVLIDTAGRQHTNENLLSEAKKIRRVAKPDLTLFVGDALSGNDAVEQATLFTQALGVDALILTKLDADVKGGAALSAVQATGKPLLFVGIGQGYGDLKPFDVDWMVARLFSEGAPN